MLSYDLSLITIHISDYRQFTNIHKSQGSVATYATCHSLSLASVKSRLLLPFWYWITLVVQDKEPLKVCVGTVCCQKRDLVTQYIADDAVFIWRQPRH